MRAVLAASLREASTDVDVGTNRGQVLAQAALIAPGARLIAFEPVPALAAELRARFPALDCRELSLGARGGLGRVHAHFREPAAEAARRPGHLRGARARRTSRCALDARPPAAAGAGSGVVKLVSNGELYLLATSV